MTSPASPAAPGDDTQANVATVRTFLAQFWDAGDLGAADALRALDYVDHAYAPPNRAGPAKTAGELWAGFADRHTTIEDVVAAGDTVVVRLTLRMTHAGPFRTLPPTGRRVSVAAYRVYRLSGGRIAEHWALLETTSLLRQLDPQPGAPPGTPLDAR